MISDNTFYNFSPLSQSEWKVVDDRVMGGISSGNFNVNEKGNGLFYGSVSTENNGGFSSIRYTQTPYNTADFKKVTLRLKGDGKNYQFRVKRNASDYFSYITSFSTSGEWEEVEIDFKDLYPSFRGRTLDMPNFDGSQIEQISFLIANKVNEDFQLELDWIKLD